jgi:hypothetical protein
MSLAGGEYVTAKIADRDSLVCAIGAAAMVDGLCGRAIGSPLMSGKNHTRMHRASLPRWLGWALAFVGAVLTLAMILILSVLIVFADEPWGDIAWLLIGFAAIGMLALIAGVRIVGTKSI